MSLSAPPSDHRSRTAERRRDAMRRRLIESAVPLWQERGPDAVVIDDVVRAAEVARGTFYKYFASVHDLKVAISEELAAELILHIEPVVSPVADPARQIALGMTLFIETARAFPLLAHFFRATGLEAAGPAALFYDYLPSHLAEGVALGRFLEDPPEVQLDLIAGAALLCVLRQIEGPAEPGHVPRVVASVLRGLGLSAAEARAVVAGLDARPLILPDQSLLVRAQRRLEPVLTLP